MEYNLDNRIILSSEREHKTLYSWSIKEIDKTGRQINRDQIPWAWSLRFEVIELIPSCKLEIQSENEDEPETARAELSQYLYGKLQPLAESRQAGLYSMFGTDREVNEFSFFIHKAAEGKDRCCLWGSVSYTSDWDFQNKTEPDCVQINIYLSAEKFDDLMKFAKFPRPTSAEIHLRGVSGFYSDWSPSIRTDSIKILANAEDQRLEDPEGLAFAPPVLGYVREFGITMQQKYPLIRKDADGA